MSTCFLSLNESDEVNELNVDDLYKRKHAKDLQQLSIFNKILNRIHKRIKERAHRKCNDRYVWFQVPEFLLGEPLYDEVHCTAYVVWRLEENGFHVQLMPPRTLFISWEHLVPSYVRSEIKKKTGMIVDMKGCVISSEESSASIPPETRVAKHVSVKHYRPSGDIYGEELFKSIDKRVVDAKR